MGQTPAIERAQYLLKIAAGIKAREQAFTEIIMREQGKTRAWASIEVGATISYFEYMASFARHIEGEIIPSDRPNETILLTKKPIGVVAGILPWNFPSSSSPARPTERRPHCWLYHRHQAGSDHPGELHRVR